MTPRAAVQAGNAAAATRAARATEATGAMNGAAATGAARAAILSAMLWVALAAASVSSSGATATDTRRTATPAAPPPVPPAARSVSPLDGPGLASHECRVAGFASSVVCGSVTRPLDPDHPNGLTIAVHYVVVPALARRKLADPVFFLAGGPGQSATEVAPGVMPLLARLNNRRDIVFVDTRGTGRSAPLVCPAPQQMPLAEQADSERQFQRLMACKAALARLPYLGSEAGLRFFTTSIAMQDLDAVRQRLGAERINLIGVSYGTRAALDYLRQFPAAVRRTVLDAVAPPDMALPASASTDAQAALDAVFSSCAANAACAQRYPALRREWTALLASLPKPVRAIEPLTGTSVSFPLTRSMLLGAVRQPLYLPATAAALPAAIDAAAHGRYEPLLGLSAMLSAGRIGQPAMGLHFSVVCAEDMPLLARAGEGPGNAPGDAPGVDFGRDDAEFYAHVCAEWPRGSVPAAFYRIPLSRSPTLLLSGGLDPATPPRHAAAVAAALGPTARQVVVPNAGHGLLGLGCVRDVVYRYIDAASDAEAAMVDARCVTSVPRPPAFFPLASMTTPASSISSISSSSSSVAASPATPVGPASLAAPVMAASPATPLSSGTDRPTVDPRPPAAVAMEPQG